MSGEMRSDPTMFEQAIQGRLVALEVENRRLRRLTVLLTFGIVGAIALSVGAAVMARSVTSNGIVTARQYELRDELGAVRGTWQVAEDGTASFTLNDRNGIERARMRLLDDGAPGIALSDAKGRSRVVLSLLADLTGTLTFADGEGNARTVLGLAEDGSSTLVFVDPFGQTRTGLGVDHGGEPSFTMIESSRTTESRDTTAGDR